MEAPQFPVGPFNPTGHERIDLRRASMVVLEGAPAALRRAIAGLTDAQLDIRYRNWTARQIVHHVADSHLNSYVRFKWTLTEDRPTIKAYDETRWSALSDSRTGDIKPALVLMDGLHARWIALLRSMTETEFARTFVHPQTAAEVSLSEAVAVYAWHSRHHTGQILWMRERHGW